MYSPVSRFLGSLLASAVALIGLWLGDLKDPKHHLIALLAYPTIIFLLEYYWLLKPDERFDTAKPPTLDFLFTNKFQAFLNKLGATERLGFRVVVLKRVLTVNRLCQWPPHISELRIVYGYNLLNSDPDYGLRFKNGQGLCGKVLETGKIGWFDRSEHTDEQFDLNKDQKSATSHLFAILSLPLRRDNTRRAHAVLCIDALTESAADSLRGWKNELHAQRNQQLVDLVAVVRMYF